MLNYTRFLNRWTSKLFRHLYSIPRFKIWGLNLFDIWQLMHDSWCVICCNYRIRVIVIEIYICTFKFEIHIEIEWILWRSYRYKSTINKFLNKQSIEAFIKHKTLVIVANNKVTVFATRSPIIVSDIVGLCSNIAPKNLSKSIRRFALNAYMMLLKPYV